MQVVILGFADWIADVADIAQIGGIALAIPASIWAYKQLKSATASAESQAVLALDQAFSLFEQFRKDLNQNSADADDVMLRRYVAVFERLGLLLEKRVMSVELADQLYGSRLEKLLKNAGDPVKSILAEKDGRGWQNFVELWNRMYQDPRTRELPPPPGAPVARGPTS